jgi:hypothetical protein
MSKILAALVAAMFAVVTTGSFAAAHAGGAPADGKKAEAKKSDKPAKKSKSSTKKPKKSADSK